MNKKELELKEFITPEFLEDGRIIFNTLCFFEKKQEGSKLNNIKFKLNYKEEK